MINTVVLTGRLTRDPELRMTPNGIEVVTFSLAFDNKSKTNGDKTTSFINCTAWRQTAKYISNYCKKGNLLGVEGSLQERRYQRKDGTNASVVEIVCSSVTNLSPRSQVSDGTSLDSLTTGKTTNSDETQPASDDIMSQGEDLADDDLPF